MNNVIKYTDKTFTTILASINADSELVDKPDWWKRMIANIGDVASMWINAQANQSYLRTAFTRQAVYDLCALIDHELAPQTTSQGILLFYFGASAILPFTVTAANLAATTKGSIAVASKRFEARAAVNVTLTTNVVDLGTAPIASNIITVTRDFTTGEKVRFTSSGSIPTGLAAATDYWVMRISATQIKIASSLPNAYNGTYLTISGGSGNLTITLFCFSATCYQQEAKNSQAIGRGDGSTQWLEVELPDKLVLRDTLIVTINSVPWTRVSSLAQSTAIDTHFVQVYKSDGSAFLMFGDGTYGAIPGDFDIYAEYAVGGGVDSNISGINSISNYAGGDSNIIAVSNSAAFTGGSDEEDMETARRIAPGLLKSRDRFVTPEDGVNLALAYGGLSQCAVIKNFYGTLSAKVIGIAIGGGNPNPGTKTTIQAYLIARSILESMDIRFVDATITSTAVTSAAKMLPGYSWANVLPYFRLAWKLFFSEAGQEIFDLYTSSGIIDTVSRINTLYTETFTSANHPAIQKLLDSFEPRSFGEDIQESDAITFIQGNIDGIDYMTITLPVFPIACSDDEITTYGALTLTEIP